MGNEGAGISHAGVNLGCVEHHVLTVLAWAAAVTVRYDCAVFSYQADGSRWRRLGKTCAFPLGRLWSGARVTALGHNQFSDRPRRKEQRRSTHAEKTNNQCRKSDDRAHKHQNVQKYLQDCL